MTGSGRLPADPGPQAGQLENFGVALSGAELIESDTKVQGD